MPDRTASGPRAGRPAVAELLLLCFAVVDGHLAVLLNTGAAAPRAAIPGAPLGAGEDPDLSAAHAARALLGRAPSWSAQGATRPGEKEGALTISYVLVVPVGTEAPAGRAWYRIGRSVGLAARASAMVEGGVALLRSRMDLEPVAFRMLPPSFTLSELQHLYELLLGRHLHKASFRRALQASYLVQPTDSWRSEGRGRPAQLFRYAPRRGRSGRHRPVRFELLR